MKINQTKQVQVDAKTLSIYTKVADRFQAELLDQDGQKLGGQSDGYVPDFMPDDHFGDYIILDIDLETGVITNWEEPTTEQIEEFINHQDV